MKFKTTVVIQWDSRDDVDVDMSAEEIAEEIGKSITSNCDLTMNGKRNPKILHAKTEFSAEIVHVEIE